MDRGGDVLTGYGLQQVKKTRTELELELLSSGNEATYLVVLELEVKACEEHDLGEVERVLRSFCGCKAGNGPCVHKGMACIMQVGPPMPPAPPRPALPSGPSSH